MYNFAFLKNGLKLHQLHDISECVIWFDICKYHFSWINYKKYRLSTIVYIIFIIHFFSNFIIMHQYSKPKKMPKKIMILTKSRRTRGPCVRLHFSIVRDRWSLFKWNIISFFYTEIFPLLLFLIRNMYFYFPPNQSSKRTDACFTLHLFK